MTNREPQRHVDGTLGPEQASRAAFWLDTSDT